MWKAIDLRKLDDLLREFLDYRHGGEKLSDFVESTIDGGFPAWDLVDSIGVVTPEDFGNDFDKEFIEQNFYDLASDWFKGLNGQVDFGILRNVIKEQWKEKQTELPACSYLKESKEALL